jgi:hypothetical protein
MVITKSYVWEHYERPNGQRVVICNHCKKSLKYHGSTTSLRNHLEDKHHLVDPAKDRNDISHMNIDTFSESIPLSSEKQRAIDDMLIDFIISAGLPLSVVEEPTFRSLVNTLNNNYIMPHDRNALVQVIGSRPFSTDFTSNQL